MVIVLHQRLRIIVIIIPVFEHYYDVQTIILLY